MQVLHLFYMIGYTVPMILHSTGFFLLCKAKGYIKNQRMLTMNLAVAEMLYCMLQVSQHLILITKSLAWIKKTASGMLLILYFGIPFFVVIVRFIYILIIIDRFLYIWLDIKYFIYITKERLRLATILHWFISASNALILNLLLQYKFIGRRIYACIMMNTILALDMLIAILALLTFAYLFIKVRNITQESMGRKNKATSSIQVWKKMEVPALMIITFLVFNISSTIINYIYMYHLTNLVLNLVNVMIILGWCTDSIIYLLIQKRVRHLIFSMSIKRSIKTAKEVLSHK